MIKAARNVSYKTGLIVESILFQKVLDHVLNLGKGVSDKLQSEDLDIVTGCDRVEDLIASVKEMPNKKCFERF